MSRVTYQTSFRSVALVTNHSTRRIELHASPIRQARGDWWQHRPADRSCSMSDTHGIEQLETLAASFCPLFHGTHGPVLEIDRPTTGLFG